MSVTIAIALFVMIIGVLIYWFAAPPKMQEIGKIMFFCGLLAVLLLFRGTFHLSTGG